MQHKFGLADSYRELQLAPVMVDGGKLLVAFMSFDAQSKSNLIFLLIAVFGMLFFWVSFIIHIDVDTIMADQFGVLDEYDKFLSGEEGVEEVWAPKGGHRFPGYKLLFFLNVYLFGYSPKLEGLTAIFVFAVGVFAITRIAMADLKGSKWIALLCIFTLVLMMMNAQTVRLSRYPLIAMRFMNFALFLLLVGIAQNIASGSSRTIKHWFGFVLMLFIAILVFGRGWGMAASGALLSIVGFHWLSDKDRFNTNVIKVHGALIGLTLLTVFTYMYGLSAKSGSGGGFQLGDFISFLLIKLGNANLGLVDMGIGRNIALSQSVAAGYLIITAIVSLHLLIRGKVTRAEWFALFVVYFSILAAATVSMAKYDQTPFFQRHNFEISVGSFGIVFFLIKYCLILLKGRAGEVIAGLFCVTILCGLIVNSHKNFKTAEKQFAYYDRIETLQQKAHLDPKSMTKQEFRTMSCGRGPENCIRIIGLMKKYGVAKKRMAEAVKDKGDK